MYVNIRKTTPASPPCAGGLGFDTMQEPEESDRELLWGGEVGQMAARQGDGVRVRQACEQLHGTRLREVIVLHRESA
jgi:hypothetical protein